MRKTRFIFFILVLILFPYFIFAQSNGLSEESLGQNVFFEARVLKVISQRELEREDGSKAIQQDLRLEGLTGEWKGKEITHKGVSDIDVLSAGVYKKGDRVVVNYAYTGEGDEKFFVVDYVRRNYLYLLAFLFSFAVVVIGRWKGVRALLGLALTFLVIMEFIIPRILAGSNPLVISLTGSLVILIVLIYFTEGLRRKSHLAILSIFFSLSITLVLSVLFTQLARLSGLAQEEAMFLIGFSGITLDFQGLLLAGILLGALGVLDDGVVSQVEAVYQIKEANPKMSKFQVFKAGFAIGNTHLGAIINTLFLAYAGASLPLLLLFKINQGQFLNYGMVINNEMIAAEIIRTMVGTLGVALSLPISTFLAAYWLKVNK